MEKSLYKNEQRESAEFWGKMEFEAKINCLKAKRDVTKGITHEEDIMTEPVLSKNMVSKWIRQLL